MLTEPAMTSITTTSTATTTTTTYDDFYDDYQNDYNFNYYYDWFSNTTGTTEATTKSKMTSTTIMTKSTTTTTTRAMQGVTYHGDLTTPKNVQETQNQYLEIGMTIFAILLVILFISLGLLKSIKERYNTSTKCKFLSWSFTCIRTYFLAFVVTIKVISAHKKRKQYRDKNYSGRYHMVEIVDEQPVYKVSLIIVKTGITFEVFSIFHWN